MRDTGYGFSQVYDEHANQKHIFDTAGKQNVAPSGVGGGVGVAPAAATAAAAAATVGGWLFCAWCC
jgi:hypothetical protein